MNAKWKWKGWCRMKPSDKNLRASLLDTSQDPWSIDLGGSKLWGISNLCIFFLKVIDIFDKIFGLFTKKFFHEYLDEWLVYHMVKTRSAPFVRELLFSELFWNSLNGDLSQLSQLTAVATDNVTSYYWSRAASKLRWKGGVLDFKMLEESDIHSKLMTCNALKTA